MIARERVPNDRATSALVDALEGFLDARVDVEERRQRCRDAAGRTAWRDLFANYQEAYGKAVAAVQQRSTSGAVQFRLPKRALPSPGSRKSRCPT